MAEKMTFLIAGCGVSGRAAASLAAFYHWDYLLLDEQDNDELRAFTSSLEYPPREVIFGWKPGRQLPKVSVAVLSPGIRKTNPLYPALQEAAAETISELEFALRHLPCPFIGITGTNGKTTVTELTTALLQAHGVKTLAAGNIGDALSGAVIRAVREKIELAVVEVSSFQLENMQPPEPVAAAILNLASDHLDRHGSMQEYAHLKFRLARHLKRGMVINYTLRHRVKQFIPDNVERTFFSARKKSMFYSLREGWICRDGRPLVDTRATALQGMHNIENMMAALALVDAVRGIEAVRDPKVLQTLSSFQASAYRIERFLTRDGVEYIDDSKATNPHSTNAALAAVASGRNVILLLGGLDKNMNFKELTDQAKHVKHAFLAGQCRDKMETEVHALFPCSLCDSFEDAVRQACAAARKGDVVMLSPATASMDMFKNYKERGDTFKRLVRDWMA